MTLILYGLAISNYVCKVEIALSLKGLNYDLGPPPDGYGSKAYKAIVPTGTIPALIDKDLVLSESDAIIEYLDEAYPDPPLIGSGLIERAQNRQLAKLHDTRFEPVLRALFPAMQRTNRDPSWLEPQLTLLTQRLEELGRITKPQPYLAGLEPGAPDCAFAPTLLLMTAMISALKRPLTLPGGLAAWHEQVSDHPAFKPVLARHRSAIGSWIVSRAR